MMTEAASLHLQRAATGPAGQSVASYLVRSVPTGRPDESAGEVRARMAGRTFADVSHVFLVEPDGRPAGVVVAGDLICAPASTPLAALSLKGAPCVVTTDTDREDAASAAIAAGAAVLAVCDESRCFVGAVPAAALIAILRDEHMEDIHHMAGILGKSEAAREALTAPPHRRALYRLPWLVVGMAGSALATATMASFEDVLAKHIALAFFVPAIVYLADAVGTQSEAVAVRGLSLTSSSLMTLLRGEVGTGILIGLVLGVVGGCLVWLGFRDLALAATVAAALFVASWVATSIGLLLPWLFARVGFDPALGSGPLATVIQDVLTLTIYFLIASLLVV